MHLVMDVPLPAAKEARLTSDKFGNVLLEGPEFETLGLIGAKLRNQ
jgi:hypothetical protein